MNPSKTMTWKENGERDLEADVSVAMLRIAANQSNRVVSDDQLKRLVPGFVVWDSELAKTKPVRSPEFWEEQVSRILNNRMADGNIIRKGYALHHPGWGVFRVTHEGVDFLKKKGFNVYP